MKEFLDLRSYCHLCKKSITIVSFPIIDGRVCLDGKSTNIEDYGWYIDDITCHTFCPKHGD